ncbi:MAG TPA: FAD-dependent oxidoreductase [Arenimonas sp.]|nr:FAD-dependent oxidoreductase [Arenimonas sp.]
MQKQDVLILGGGVIGLSCALFLLKQGRSVRILEKNTVGAATSHGNCGTITPSHALPLPAPGMITKALKYMAQSDAPFYVKPSTDLALLEWLLRFSLNCNAKDMQKSAIAKSQLLNSSRSLLQDTIATHQMQCNFLASGVMYAFKTQQGLDDMLHELPILKQCSVDAEVLTAEQLAEREPALKPMYGAVYFPGDAHFRPDAYCAELARVVRELGGIIEEYCEVQSLQCMTYKIQSVQTTRGNFEANDVVMAMAVWSSALAKSVDVHLPIQPGKGYSITYSKPEIMPNTPLVLFERSVCVTAWSDGYRLGSTMEFSGFDETLNAKRLAALERGAHEYLHEPFGDEVKERWYGWRPMTYDDMPIIGKSPKHTNLYFATGHGMLGMSMSAITGQLIAELICGQSHSINIAPFSPARF